MLHPRDQSEEMEEPKKDEVGAEVLREGNAEMEEERRMQVEMGKWEKALSVLEWGLVKGGRGGRYSYRDRNWYWNRYWGG
jgi:hypothetical protein